MEAGSGGSGCILMEADAISMSFPLSHHSKKHIVNNLLDIILQC